MSEGKLVYIPNVTEALILLEAARRGYFKMTKSRLSQRQKGELKSGSTYIYNETESGIKRWSDGNIWSASKLKKGFFVYHQHGSTSSRLIKRAISILAPDGNNYHVINYVDLNDVLNKKLIIPSKMKFPEMNEIRESLDGYKYKMTYRNKKLTKSSQPLDRAQSTSFQTRKEPGSNDDRVVTDTYSLSSEDRRQLSLINENIRF